MGFPQIIYFPYGAPKKASLAKEYNESREAEDIAKFAQKLYDEAVVDVEFHEINNQEVFDL